MSFSDSLRHTRDTLYIDILSSLAFKARVGCWPIRHHANLKSYDKTLKLVVHMSHVYFRDIEASHYKSEIGYVQKASRLLTWNPWPKVTIRRLRHRWGESTVIDMRKTVMDGRMEGWNEMAADSIHGADFAFLLPQTQEGKWLCTEFLE